MRKLFAFLLAALLVIGLAVIPAVAHNTAYNAKDTMGNILVPVFNNAGATIDAGDVVVWQIGSSTGNDDAYVTTTTTSDTGIVAGVVWPAGISDQSVGSIAIWGKVQCDIAGTGVGVNGPLCTSGTAGGGQACADNAIAYGVATVDAGAGTQADCFVNP